MDFIIVLFRDKISGFWYFLYILACIFFMFVLLGIVGDRKRKVIADRLKEKKKRDIESGKEAQIAAMESKQVLDVMKDPAQDGTAQNSTDTGELAKKEEAPTVLVIGADGSSNAGTNNAAGQVAQPSGGVQTSAPAVQPMVQQSQQIQPGANPVANQPTQG